jgi:hypothetical protein
MSLCDFLGDTSQIKIIDFFIGDAGNSYNISVLSELTGLTRMTLSKFIPELVQSKILEIDQKAGNVKTYRLSKNKLVELLVAAAYAYSAIQGADPLDKEESVERIRKGLGFAEVSSGPIMDEDFRVELPGEVFGTDEEWSFQSKGTFKLTRQEAKQLRDMLDEKIRDYESQHGEILIDE